MKHIIFLALAVFLVGCVTSESHREWLKNHNSLTNLEARGAISESQKYQRSLSSYMNVKDKNYVQLDYLKDRLDIALAYDKREIDFAEYSRLKRIAINELEREEDRQLERSRAIGRIFGEMGRIVSRTSDNVNFTGGPDYDWDFFSNNQYRCRTVTNGYNRVAGQFAKNEKCTGMPLDDDRWPN
jgi:hypothetical protein